MPIAIQHRLQDLPWAVGDCLNILALVIDLLAACQTFRADVFFCDLGIRLLEPLSALWGHFCVDGAPTSETRTQQFGMAQRPSLPRERKLWRSLLCLGSLVPYIRERTRIQRFPTQLKRENTAIARPREKRRCFCESTAPSKRGQGGQDSCGGVVAKPRLYDNSKVSSVHQKKKSLKWKRDLLPNQQHQHGQGVLRLEEEDELGWNARNEKKSVFA